MADDHAAKAISAYGAGLNKTPHLDRIAKYAKHQKKWLARGLSLELRFSVSEMA